MGEREKDNEPTWQKCLDSTVNGSAVGAGFGLLTCDFIDLRGGDISAFNAWLGAIIVGVIVGAAIGCLRRHSQLTRSESRWPIVRWRFQILGAAILCEGLLVAGTIPRYMPCVIYAVTMVLAGTIYLAVGLLITLRSSPSL